LKTVRLERGEGDARVFWEITRDGTKIRTRFGKHLAAGRTTPFKAYPNNSDAEKAFTGAIAAKRKEGYGEVVTRAVAGANSQKGARAINPELEAMIAEAPGDADRYLVYADWLMQHGDPRGELIIAQHGIATSDLKDVSKFERDERALFKQYEQELLGGHAEYKLLRNSHRSFRIFSWRYGFIRSAHLAPLTHTRHSVNDVLPALCGHPSGHFLENLILGQIGLEHHPLFAFLRKDAPATLRSLIVGDGRPWDRSRLDRLWPLPPMVRRLVLAGPITSVGTIEAPALESLTISVVTPDVLAALSRVSLPALRALRLTVDAACEPLKVAAVIARFPVLEHVRIRRWVFSHDRRELIRHDEVATAVVAAAAERRLERLDLEIPLATAEPLRPAREIGALHLPRAAVEGTPALPNLVWTDSPEEEEINLAEIDIGPPIWP
jgi:uncharacterized protein (TIGR02996 family)